MKHKNWLISIMLTLVLLLSLIGIASADEEGPHPMNADPPPVEAPSGSAVISNGTISLGVDSLGHLNFSGTGLLYLPTGGEVLNVGCLCEGWGAADAISFTQGWSSVAFGVSSVAPVSFTSTASTAKSVTTVGGILRVTHDYHPTPATPNLYEIDVTIDNISAASVDMRYTRDQDWDVPPTPFFEFVTIHGTAAEPTVLYADNNGFATPGPLFGRVSLGAVGDFVDFGPMDQGSLFDFGFGMVPAGGSVKFTIYYGAAATEASALGAIAAVGANVYSLGQYSGDPAGGTPNTFIFAYGKNQPPIADPNGPYLGPAGSPITFDGTSSSDPDGDPLTYDWDWGDSSTSLNAGATPSHTYADADIYDVCLTVTDPGGLSDTACTIVVVFDPSAGFVTGGGWIDSPAGAYRPDTSLAGKANFGFVSKYKKGADKPTGTTEFQFHAGDLNFHSSSYDWLVVTGSNYARFKGLGTINGEGVYKFMLWAGDGIGTDGADTFRIKIWTEDSFGVETVVYDNDMNQDISGGSIVIHTKKK